MKNKIAIRLKYCPLCGAKTKSYINKHSDTKSYYCTGLCMLEVIRPLNQYLCSEGEYIYLFSFLKDVSLYISYNDGFYVSSNYMVGSNEKDWRIRVDSHIDGLKFIKRYCDNLCLR